MKRDCSKFWLRLISAVALLSVMIPVGLAYPSKTFASTYNCVSYPGTPSGSSQENRGWRYQSGTKVARRVSQTCSKHNLSNLKAPSDTLLNGLAAQATPSCDQYLQPNATMSWWQPCAPIFIHHLAGVPAWPLLRKWVP